MLDNAYTEWNMKIKSKVENFKKQTNKNKKKQRNKQKQEMIDKLKAWIKKPTHAER